jgi:uncharacterized membrane protein
MNRERMTGSSRTIADKPTTLGLSERLERVLAYLFLWVGALVLFVIEQRNQNVRWHAKQSMAVFGPLCILWWLAGFLGGLLGSIPLIGGLFGIAFGLLANVFFWIIICLAIWLLIMAWFRPAYRLPFISNWLR